MTNARNSNSRREGEEEGGGRMWRSGMGSWREKMLNEMKWNYGILLREYMVWWATVYASFPSLSLTQSLPLSLSLCRLAMWPGCKCWNFKPLNVAIVFDEWREDREGVQRLTGWREGGVCWNLPAPIFTYTLHLSHCHAPCLCAFANWAVSKRF